MRLSDPQRNVCIKVERAKATVEKRVEDGERERGGQMIKEEREEVGKPWTQKRMRGSLGAQLAH